MRGAVHVLAAGLAYQGIAVPLGVRTWPQNVPLPPGEYWRHLHALLSDVQAALPPELRDHVVLVADRGYGVPRMLDLAQALGWAWVVRLPGQTALCLRQGRVLTAASLAPRPGTVAGYPGTLDDFLDPDDDAPDPPSLPSAPPAGAAVRSSHGRPSGVSGLRVPRNPGSWRPTCPVVARSS